MSTSNVNVTLFARNVEWDFFSDFQTPCRYRPTMALPALIEALSVESEKTWNPLWNGAMFQPCSECLTTCLDHNNKDRNPWRKTNLRIVEEIAFFRLFFCWNVATHSLKIIQNVSFQFFIPAFSISFRPIESLSANFRFFKNRQNRQFLAFSMSFCPLKMWTLLASLAMLNETFSVIFKYCL